MTCTKEEIERKRLQALQRRKEAQLKYGGSMCASPHNKVILSNGSNVQHKSTVITSFSTNTNTHVSPQHPRTPQNSWSPRQNFPSNKGRSPGNETPNISKELPKHNTSDFFGQRKVISGTCSMITEERFKVETSSFFPPLIEVFKSVPSKSYDMKTRTWNFHIKDYQNLMGKLIDFKMDVQVKGLPKFVLKTFLNLRPTKNLEFNLSHVDPILLNSLMPFQHEGVCYGISRNGRCMIADDMGLGKTIQALGIAHYFKDSWPLLIVTPSSVRYQWSDAILEFLPSVPTMYVQQFANAKDVISDYQIVIVSYDLLSRTVKTFEKKHFGIVILDECHGLKSTKTARYTAVQTVIRDARHVVLLSGTPILSRPMELYSQIKLIMPTFMAWQDYGIRYCNGKLQSFGWDFSGSSNMQELQLLLKHTCMIRRLKSDVLHQLPSKKREVITLDPALIKAGTEEMIEMAEKLQKRVLNSLERHHAILQYYFESSFAKQKAVCDYVTNLFKNKEKCLIYAHHQNVLDAICELAEAMDVRYIRIDGKTSPEKRKHLVDEFQNHDDCLAAVLSITAANAGITLTAARLVVFAELFWNPGILCQAEDRVHRIGQDSTVVIRYLVAQQTVDDYLWPILKKKISVLTAVGLENNFSFNDAHTKSHVQSNQRTLDSFAQPTLSPTNESKAEITETTTETRGSQSNISITSDELKDFFDLSENDFDACDWDSIP